MALNRGRRIAIDPGTVRVGIAISDPEGIIASPLTTLGPGDVGKYLFTYLKEEEISHIYLGLPLHLSGVEGSSATMAREMARELSALLPVPIYLLDERLTTAGAVKRKNPADSTGIDELAAVTLLEFALQSERTQGRIVGEKVEP